jgi:hypothetical protein
MRQPFVASGGHAVCKHMAFQNTVMSAILLCRTVNFEEYIIINLFTQSLKLRLPSNSMALVSTIYLAGSIQLRSIL